MSAVTKTVAVTCPRCGARGEAPIWDEVDAQQARRDARHVLNETLFEVRCNQCNKKMSLNYPLSYHDGELKFFVEYVTDPAKVEAAALSVVDKARAMRADAAYAAALDEKRPESEAQAEAARAAAMADEGALDGYRLRIVTSRNALREKIVILRNGLDDRAVEVLKLTTFNLAASQGKLKGATEAYFGGVKKSGDVIIDFVGGRRHREMKVPVSLYETVCADVQTHAGRMPTEGAVAGVAGDERVVTKREAAGRAGVECATAGRVGVERVGVDDDLFVDREWAKRFLSAHQAS